MIGAAIGSSDGATAAVKPQTTVAAPGNTVARTTTQTPTYDVPSVTNLSPEVTITEKKCYGSAGCNFEYELRLTTTGSPTFAPGKRYRVTVALDEGTSWERIHSITLSGTKADVITSLVSSRSTSDPVPVIKSVTPL
ncbi:hypothetical protein GCM10011591_43690 [Nocardia camponoti]|uniref:Uncharacterized protein n=1 Tax=Nocardia camponoti TaxID=1616106 RepID=A0A917QTN8_9NOCA|nr:hypothetical protein GCM10011591_43690 [Nocardia camponoti]